MMFAIVMAPDSGLNVCESNPTFLDFMLGILFWLPDGCASP